MQNSAKVGALVIAFMAMLYGGYAFLGQKLFGPKTKTFYAEFNDAGGLSAGTRILMSGVNVGTVTKVSLVSPTKAKMTLAINPEVGIPAETVAQLPTSLTGLGEQILLLVPPKTSTNNLLEGEVLVGRKQKALDSFLPNGEETIAELTKTLAAFRRILEDQSLMGGFKDLLGSTNQTMKEFGKTSASVNGLIVSNQAALAKTLNSAASTAKNIEGMTQELYALSKSGKLQGDLTATLSNIRKASEEGTKMVAEMNKLISEPELQAALKGSAANIKTMTESGVKMAANGEGIAKNVEKMTADGPEISRKVSDLMTKANEIATKISGIADDIKGAIGKVSKVVEGGGQNPLSNIETRFDLLQESKPSFLRTDVLAIFPDSKGDSFQLGLFNAFEQNKLIAQYSKKFDDNLSLRYGIFASKPGLGVDYRLSPRTSMRGDVFSLNDPRFDLRFRYEFGGGLIGWFGVDRVFKDNAPLFGIGIRR
jgi:phospholipid/cholesterol/gamma-HCH transport system substrate-binding protein